MQLKFEKISPACASAHPETRMDGGWDAALADLPKTGKVVDDIWPMTVIFFQPPQACHPDP